MATVRLGVDIHPRLFDDLTKAAKKCGVTKKFIVEKLLRDFFTSEQALLEFGLPGLPKKKTGKRA